MASTITAYVYSIDGVIPVIEEGAFIHPQAVIIGDVVIETGCYIGPGAALRGDLGRIVVKKGSNIQDNCVMHSFPERECYLEEDSHVGHGAILHGCHVGRNSLIGMNCVVMDGVNVGEECIVGAMSFVRAGTEIPRRSLFAGSPARLVRELSDDDVDWKSGGTREYQFLARRSLDTLKPVDPLTRPEKDRPALKTLAAVPLHERRRRTGSR